MRLASLSFYAQFQCAAFLFAVLTKFNQNVRGLKVAGENASGRVPVARVPHEREGLRNVLFALLVHTGEQPRRFMLSAGHKPAGQRRQRRCGCVDEAVFFAAPGAAIRSEASDARAVRCRAEERKRK